MAGWNLTRGEIRDWKVSDDQYWSLFNFVFSTGAKKKNTYKFALIKSILDNLFNATETDEGSFISYTSIFDKFTENYWNLVVRDGLRQTDKDKHEYSYLEQILMAAVEKEPALKAIPFFSIDEKTHESIVKNVTKYCKLNVIGALYENFNGCLYSFARSGPGITLAPRAYEFLIKYKVTIEKLNYFAWAKFLEKINPEEKTVRLLDSLEEATPKRTNLDPYRDFLLNEHHDHTCFYCGKKLGYKIEVDHAVPWSFVKDNKLWNFVLACPHCNRSKNNKLVPKKLVPAIERRNHEILSIDAPLVKEDMSNYSDELLDKMWIYANRSGFQPYQLEDSSIIK